MNVGFSIPIHKYGEEYIKETLSQYKEVERMREIENPIIHMYAVEDTHDPNTGELRGYNDSLFCEYHYYDTKNMTVFKTQMHDGLFVGDVPISNIKVFKDGSTLVHIKNGKYQIQTGTAVFLYKL